MPQHFVASPEWHWYIVWYFFLGGIAGRRLRPGRPAAAGGRPRGRGGRAARVPRQLPGARDLPDPPDARPREAHAVLAHADRRPDLAADAQVLVADVAGRVGPGRLRDLRDPVLRRGAGARWPAPAPAGAAGGRCAERRLRPALHDRRRVPRALHRRIHGSPARRQQPAGLERHLGPRRAFPGLGAQHGRGRDRAVRVVAARRPGEPGEAVARRPVLPPARAGLCWRSSS